MGVVEVVVTVVTSHKKGDALVGKQRRKKAIRR